MFIHTTLVITVCKSYYSYAWYIDAQGANWGKTYWLVLVWKKYPQSYVKVIIIIVIVIVIIIIIIVIMIIIMIIIIYLFIF